MLTVLITGSSGQLGYYLKRQYGMLGYYVDKEGIDFTDPLGAADTVDRILTKIPTIKCVINTAAMTDTRLCEKDQGMTFNINTHAPYKINRVCAKRGVAFAQISTDYVFDGEKGTPYVESDNPRALNAYGKTKQITDDELELINPKYYLLRVASLYSEIPGHHNILNQLLYRLKVKTDVEVVDDIFMSPTWAFDCAKAIYTIVEEEIPYGAYHITNGGGCSWYEFATKVKQYAFLEDGATIIPVSHKKFKEDIKRPFNTILSNEKASKYLEIASWENALKRCLL
jgi:dTDP-4-dehydrorhamnose reductase